MTPTHNLVQDDAELRFREALQFHPNSPKVLANFAAYLVSQKRNHDEAEELYERALALDPDNVKLLLEVGGFFEKVRRYKGDAESLYRRAVEREPQNTGALKALARCVGGEERQTLLCRVIEQNPHDGEAVCDFISNGKDWESEESERLLRTAISGPSPDPHCCELLAAVLERRHGEPDEISKLSFQAADMHSDCPRCVSEAARRAVNGSDPDEAFRRCRQQLKVDRRWRSFNDFRGIMQWSDIFPQIMRWADTNPREIDQLCREFLEVDPYNFDLLQAWSAFLTVQNRREEAASLAPRLRAAELLAEFQSLRDLDCYLRGGGTVEEYRAIADRCFPAVMALAPNWSRPVRLYALELMSAPERRAEIELLFRRYLELEPEDTSMRRSFAGFMCNELKNAAVAERLYRGVLKDELTCSSAMKGLASILWEKGALDEAESLLRKAADVEPGSAALSGYLARFLHEVRGDCASAAKLYFRASRQGRRGSVFAWKAAQLCDDVDEQERRYRAVLRTRRSHPAFLVDFGLFLWKRRAAHEEAASLFRRALEIDPVCEAAASHLNALQREVDGSAAEA